MKIHKIKAYKPALLSGACLTLLFLAGCSFEKGTHNTVISAQQSYSHIAPLELNLAQIRVDVMPASGRKEYLALFPSAPNIAIEKFLNRRFQSTPYGNGLLEVSVDGLQIDRTRVSGGKSGIISNVMQFNDNYEYSLNTSVTMRYQDRLGGNRAATTFDLQKSIIMPSHLSISKKEKHMQNFLENFINDMDKIISERAHERISRNMY